MKTHRRQAGASAPAPLRSKAAVTATPTNPLSSPARTHLTASTVIEEAMGILAIREVTHGSRSANFRNIADVWNGWWKMICRERGGFAGFLPSDVSELMELLKLARRHSGTFNLDDYIDTIGYAGITAELRSEEQ